MNKYTSVRIDNETMKKLERIVLSLQRNNLGKVSKALAIKYVVNSEFERLAVREEKEEYLVVKNNEA